MKPMQETVSVYQAMRKGHRTVNYPSVAIFLGLLFATGILCVCELLPFWSFPIGFVVALAASWLYWAFMITRWRLWAFDEVRNVHELRKKAIKERLIWPDGSFFERTELRNFEQKQRWLILQEKFKEEDIFINDLTIAPETSIYYSRGEFWFGFVALLIVGVAGLYFGIVADSYLGLLAPAVVAVPAVLAFKKATNSNAQITVSEMGMYTVKAGFTAWAEVRQEEALIVGHGKYAKRFLHYTTHAGQQRVRIDGLTTDIHKLNHLLQIYRGRFEQKTASLRFRQLRSTPKP